MRWEDSPVIGSVYEGARRMWSGKGAVMMAVKLMECALTLDQEPRAKDCRWYPESRKDRKTDPLSSSRRNQPCLNLWFVL